MFSEWNCRRCCHTVCLYIYIPALVMLACCPVLRNWSVATSLMSSEWNCCRCCHIVCLYIYVPGDVGVLPCVQKLIHGHFLNVQWVKSLPMLSHCVPTHECLLTCPVSRNCCCCTACPWRTWASAPSPVSKPSSGPSLLWQVRLLFSSV